MPSIPETGAGTTSEGSFSRSASSYSFIRQEQKSQRHGVWSELGRLVQNAWPGYGSIGIFLVVGYCTCHETGPSVLVSILIGGISCIISGKCYWYSLYGYEEERKIGQIIERNAQRFEVSHI